MRDRVHRFLHPRLPRRLYDPPLGYVGCRVCDEEARRLEDADAQRL